MKKHKNSFDFDADRPVPTRRCACAGCDQAGDYRAPKSRENLTDYLWFCLEHVRAYNASWDYFGGLSEAEIEAQIRKATVWDRPSWPLGEGARFEKDLRSKILHDFFGDPVTPEAEARPASPVSQGEVEALALLGLVSPVTFADIKAQYRLLVKRHHPDANGGSAESEARFKDINQAFAWLRKHYETEDNETL